MEEGVFPQMAAPFGGGFGGTHRLPCGALSGGLLALGAARAEGRLTQEESYEMAARLVNDFERTFSTALCCELVGLDPDSPDWQEAYRAEQAYSTICWPCAEFAVRQCWELVESTESNG